MNERIRELAEQAGLISKQDDRENWQEYINDVGKFSELLIKECSSFLKDTLDDHFAAEQLEEHFGVREQTASQKMAAAGYTRRPRGWTKEGTE